MSPTSPTTSTVSKRDTERNLAEFQAFMQVAWVDLTDKQRDIWNVLSVSESTNDLLWDLNDPHMTMYVLPLQFQTQHLLTVIHRNRATFNVTISKIMHTLMGTGSYRVGEAVFHIHAGWRDSNGDLQVEGYV